MISEVELTGNVNSLMEEFRAAYRERHGIDYICENIGIDSTILRDIIKFVGFSRAKILVKGYLKQSGDKEWFLRKGHTLQVLRDNLNAVNAAIGGARASSYRIRLESQCPHCQKYFYLNGDANEVCHNVHRTICETCEKLLANS